MSRARDALAAVGVITVGVGLAFVMVPSLASALSVPRVALYMLGAIAGVEGIRSIQTRRRTEIDGADLPEPESGIDLDRPGDEFDRLVVRWSTWHDHRRIASADQRVQRHLGSVALNVIMARSSVSREGANDRLEAGTWTDDPVAAAFLGGSEVPRAPWSVRLRGIVRAGSISRFYVTRTVEAIVTAWEER